MKIDDIKMLSLKMFQKFDYAIYSRQYCLCICSLSYFELLFLWIIHTLSASESYFRKARGNGIKSRLSGYRKEFIIEDVKININRINKNKEKKILHIWLHVNEKTQIINSWIYQKKKRDKDNDIFKITIEDE